jgi:uncharacterized protein
MTASAKTMPAKRITDPKLLELLVCPLTKGTLTYDAEKQELISARAKLRYPIRDGIPILLADEAKPILE